MSRDNNQPHLPQTRSWITRKAALWLALASALCSSRASAESLFLPLGYLSGDQSSLATGISADGTYVSGTSASGVTLGSSATLQAVRWTVNYGAPPSASPLGLGHLPGDAPLKTLGYGVSADGTSVVGSAFYGNSSGYQRSGYLWNNNSMQNLDDIPHTYSALSAAIGTNRNGTVVVGVAQTPEGARGFRWDLSNPGNKSVSQLGALPGSGLLSQAVKVSADGSVVGGIGYNSNASVSVAYRWDNGTPTALGDLNGGATQSWTYGISDDGTTIVGYGTSDVGREAVLWRGTDAAPQELGYLPNPGNAPTSEARGASVTGMYVVGTASTVVDGTTTSGAFLWDAAHGMRAISDLLVAAGVDLTGWTLTEATDISNDGSTIVGFGTHNGHMEAWLARLGNQPDFAVPEPATFVLLGTGLLGAAALARRRRRP